MLLQPLAQAHFRHAAWVVMQEVILGLLAALLGQSVAVQAQEAWLHLALVSIRMDWRISAA